MPGGEMQDNAFFKVETIIGHSQKLQDDLQKLGLKIKHHENNLKFLKNQSNKLDDSILEMQVSLGRYHSSGAANIGHQNHNDAQTEQNTIEQIVNQDKTAASILYQVKLRHESAAINSFINKGVVGVVATLAKVHDDNLSRLLSEYLGLETMLAIVCKANEDVEALELYTKEGQIDNSAGLHGLGSSIGRPLDGRFLVISLQELRPYAGKFVPGDPQKRLALLKPKLPNGECPTGFLGFAVNMIDVDYMNLSCLTPAGHGLRETLFYRLFSRLQVYRTRADMQRAVACISDGALSLDGGMMRSTGVLCLGSRKDIEVRFPISSINFLPDEVNRTMEQIKLLEWEKERISEDMQREEASLDHVKSSFDLKKQVFVKYLGESSPYVTQDAHLDNIESAVCNPYTAILTNISVNKNKSMLGERNSPR